MDIKKIVELEFENTTIDPGNKMAFVCASNNNRSMAAHHICINDTDIQNEFQYFSYGIGSACKLPGIDHTSVNSYKFGTPYTEMINDLRNQNELHYTELGLFEILERNVSIKEYPERFQDAEEIFDFIFSYESRVFDIILAHLGKLQNKKQKLVHIINIETPDNAENAKKSAEITLEIVKNIQSFRTQRAKEDAQQNTDPETRSETHQQSTESMVPLYLIEIAKKKPDIAIMHSILFY